MSFITDFDAIVDCPGLELQELGLLVYFFRNQGEGFVFLTDVIESKFNISAPTYHKIKKKLSKNHFISSVNVRENGKVKGCKITVLIDNIIAAAKNSKLKKAEFNNSEFKKVEVRNVEFNEAEFNKNGHINGVNKKGSKSIKGVNSVREGDSVPAAPCDTIPAGTQTSLLPPDIPPAPVPAPEKASTKFIPPTKEEVRAKLEAVLTEKGTIQHWNESELQSFTDRFFDWYDSAHWLKNDGRKMKDWQRALSVTWLGKREYLPEKSSSVPAFPGAPVNQQRQQPKSFKQQDLDYANRRFNDPIGEAIRAAVDACLGMGGDDPCEYGLPEQYREQAVKLLQEERKRLSQSFNPFPDFPELP